jgi:hypothetical protein
MMVFGKETMFARSSYAGAGQWIMGNITRTEVEELARALARHHKRRWSTMPARNLESDPNGGREAWLKRAHIVLEAVDRAISLEIQRAIGAPGKGAAPTH